MIKHDAIAVLFSGGTDSTLAAALMAENYKKIHLVTYDRSGFFCMRNSMFNAKKLTEKYGEVEFEHEIINIDKLTRYVFYERYFRNILRHGFFLLSICGLCKLAMHMRTIIYCVDNKINSVCDGANQGMDLFPAQMTGVIAIIKDMYARFGIHYTTPVFDYEGPEDTGFVDRLHLERIGLLSEQEASAEKDDHTTGKKLFELGFIPVKDVKGTPWDRKMQGRCFQFILFNIFVKWYYLCDHSYEEYQFATLKFYKEKIFVLTQDLKDYIIENDKSRLFKYIKG